MTATPSPTALAFAFAGRVSTEDLQDPETSRNWQRTRAEALITPAGGRIVTEFFDVGYSRSLPWKRRPRAAALLAALKDPDRGFDAVVIGEPQRVFYGNQYGLTQPVFAHYGVQLWVPEVGGAVDPDSEAHDLVMSVFGGMSKGERTRIKIRVRTAMASQAALEGRYLGGRPPYGYRLADAGPHPNPIKARDGKRLRCLEPDPTAAPVIQRIFAEYLRGKGLYAIAEGLTRDNIPCPSAHDRARNPHRHGNAWAKSAIRAILLNPRYTGHQVWNRQRKDEVLLDVEDVALGHITKLRWNDPEKWIKSAGLAHEPLITTGDFEQAQLKLATKSAATHPVERKPRTTDRTYALRGLLRCGLCERKMQGNFNNGHPHYRCRYPSEYAQSRALDHPLTVYLREDALLPALDSWIGTVFAPGRLKCTIHEMQEAQAVSGPDPVALEAARRDLDTSAARLTSYRAALDAGGDPATVAGWINEARLDQTTAQQRLNQLTAEAPPTLTADQIQALITELGNLTDRLMQATPARKAPLYEAFGLNLTYNAKKRIVTVESRPASSMCVSKCPRGDLNPHAR
ncbi:recombinase family protein [Kitasatospora sp. NBC_01287]|uniref:recombinase family protein n=1 Tax=Kitasatospora sp. NBC_01287 TaxID=2903573 RepID=UPI002253EDB0|nr:recombinase family protein [Kitasatospora sp. NBC_01287]MCX4750606.1 recombinase family protein [Kitasatospora sp. NBC_01287]